MQPISEYFARLFNFLKVGSKRKNGRYDLALLDSKCQDIAILNDAGMILSLLKFELITPYHVNSLLQLDRYEEAYSMLSKIPIQKSKIMNNIFGRIAITDPIRCLALLGEIEGFEKIKRYCNLVTNGSGDQTFDDSLTMIALDLRNKKFDRLEEKLSDYFKQFGLETPRIAWGKEVFTINAIQNHSNEKIQTDIQPLISIVLTAHNEEKYISAAVESIRAQTWPNFELIIIDDASTDDTGKIVDEFAELDSRIKVIHLDKNVGLWSSKNIGFRECKGEIITMHDADDWSHPQKLENQLKALRSDKSAVCSSSYLVRVTEEGELFTRNVNSYLRWNPSSFMFYRKVLDKVGNFFEDLLGGDCEFIARVEIAFGPETHKKVKEPLSFAMQRSHSLSNKFRDIKTVATRFEHWEKWRKLHLLYGKRQEAVHFQNIRFHDTFAEQIKALEC